MNFFAKKLRKSHYPISFHNYVILKDNKKKLRALNIFPSHSEAAVNIPKFSEKFIKISFCVYMSVWNESETQKTNILIP